MSLLYSLPPSIEEERGSKRGQPDNILDDNPQRWVSLPIQFHKIWDAYKDHESHMWTAEDVDVVKVPSEFNSLSTSLQTCLKTLLSVDSATIFGEDDKENSYGVPSFKLDRCAASSALTNDLQIPEARAFFGFQASYENILNELQGVTLLSICNDDEDTFMDIVATASKSKFGILRAIYWQRHVWDENEIELKECCPSIQERVLAVGLLKRIQCLGHRLLSAVIVNKYPLLINSALHTVLKHTIETAERHSNFAMILHKSFSEPLTNESCQALLDLFMTTEIEFLQSMLSDHFIGDSIKELGENDARAISSSFQFSKDQLSSDIITKLPDGSQVIHIVNALSGDTMVEYEDDHAQMVGGLTNDNMTAFTINDDSDF